MLALPAKEGPLPEAVDLVNRVLQEMVTLALSPAPVFPVPLDTAQLLAAFA